MYENKCNLTIQDIYEKDFKMDARGYRPQEVDQFLDIIMQDYKIFMTNEKKHLEEIRALESDNSKLQAEARKLRASLDIAGSNKGITNVDLLKRISELEKVVYGEE